MRFEPILILVILALPVCSAAGDSYLSVSDMTMVLNGPDAVFQVNYSLDALARIYVLALGCGFIEPDLVSLLDGYGDVAMVSANPSSASLLVKNAGDLVDGYSLFNSMPIKVRVARFTVVYPGGLSRTFYNLNATPNVFCEAKNVSV